MKVTFEQFLDNFIKINLNNAFFLSRKFATFILSLIKKGMYEAIIMCHLANINNEIMDFLLMIVHQHFFIMS